jgi:hypothetical protein
MESMQRLRARAMAAGALASTPQQRVVLDDNAIQILPAQTDSIYAPVYDTDVVYSDEPYYGYGGPFINFGAALPVGLWLSYCLDWGGHSVWVGGWGAWHGPGGWHHPRFVGGRAPPGTRPWHPPERGPGTLPPNRGRRGDSLPLPHPMAGAPDPPPAHFKNPSGRAVAPPGAPGSSVPLPRTAAPPADRPRLQPGFASPPDGGRATEAERRYVPVEGTARVQGNVPARDYSPGTPGSVPAHEYPPAPPPAARPEPVREAAPAPPHQAAPPAVHESAPAPAATPDSKNR